MADILTAVRRVAQANESGVRFEAVQLAVSLLQPNDLSVLDEVTRDPSLDGALVDIVVAHFEDSARASWSESLLDWVATLKLGPERTLRILSDVAWAQRARGAGVLSDLRFVDLVSLGLSAELVSRHLVIDLGLDGDISRRREGQNDVCLLVLPGLAANVGGSSHFRGAGLFMLLAFVLG